MGLHRLFLVPDGFDAKDGVYVRYPAEELYAILCLESHRHRTQIVGENLGTVPRYVNQAMRRHGFSATYVLPFEIDVRGGAIRTPRAASVASLNTHDLPPFATWWSGDDVAERERMGQLSGDDAANERAARKAEQETAARFLNQNGFLAAGGLHSSDDVRRALTRFLAEGPARLVLVNLEDLWGEREPQNMPGTSSERPNWRRKARLSLEEMRASSQVVDQLADIERARNGDYGDSKLRSDDA
jgi:4-alpha-glucanotransferase